MARSSYIYLLYTTDIQYKYIRLLVGAFTVLHELKTYVERHPDHYRAYRHKDGNPDHAVTEVEL